MHANKAAAHLWCSIYTSTQLFFPLLHPPSPLFLALSRFQCRWPWWVPRWSRRNRCSRSSSSRCFPLSSSRPCSSSSRLLCYSRLVVHSTPVNPVCFFNKQKNQEFWFWRWTLTAAQRPWHSHCELLLESPLINCTSRPIGPISWQASIRDSWESRAQSDRTMKAEWRVIDDVIFGAVFCQRRSTFLTHGYHWKKKKRIV